MDRRSATTVVRRSIVTQHTLRHDPVLKRRIAMPKTYCVA
jgi:hypothetical protein